MDVVDVHENIVTRELTSTAISSVVVKAESINSMDGRVASLVVDDLSGRNIVANDIVSHGNIHSQTLNVTSVQVVLSRREPYPVHPKYGCITWIVCARVDVGGAGRCVVIGRRRFGRIMVSDKHPFGRRQNINVHASSSDRWIKCEYKSYRCTHGGSSNDMKTRPYELYPCIQFYHVRYCRYIRTLRCGVLTDDSAVTIASGTFDAQAAYAKFGDTGTSLSTERLSTRDGDIINLRTANAIVNSIEAEEVSIPHIVSRWRVHFHW
jgi:hypothetical protein